MLSLDYIVFLFYSNKWLIFILAQRFVLQKYIHSKELG